MGIFVLDVFVTKNLKYVMGKGFSGNEIRPFFQEPSTIKYIPYDC